MSGYLDTFVDKGKKSFVYEFLTVKFLLLFLKKRQFSHIIVIPSAVCTFDIIFFRNLSRVSSAISTAVKILVLGLRPEKVNTISLHINLDDFTSQQSFVM